MDTGRTRPGGRGAGAGHIDVRRLLAFGRGRGAHARRARAGDLGQSRGGAARRYSRGSGVQRDPRVRTPLALLNLAGETMAVARVQAPERLEEYIGVVRRESAALMRLVDKTLELSKLESGEPRVSLRAYQSGRSGGACVTRFRDRLPDRDLDDPGRPG